MVMVPMPQQQVGVSSPLPDARLNPSAPAAAFPGAVNTRPNLSGVVDEAEQLHQQELQRANVIRVTSGLSDLMSAKNDAEAQLWQSRGTQALGLSEKIQSQFKERASQIANQMTPAQQVMFQQHAIAEGLDLQATVQRHVSNEMQRVADESYQSLDQGFAGDAIKHAAQGDYDAVNADIDKRLGNLHTYAVTAGLPKEVVDERAQQIVSNTRFNVMASFAKAGQLASAIAYYQKYKDDFTGQDAEKAAPMVKAAQKQNDGELAARDILSTPNISPTEALAKADAIEDPAAAKVASEAVMLHFNQLNAAQKMEREGAQSRVIQNMEQNGGKLNKASPDWQLIDGHTEGEYVLEKQRQFLKPPADPGDPDKFNTYLAMAATSPETRRALLSTDVTKIVNDNTMNDTQKRQVLTLIRTERQRDETQTLSDLTRQQSEANAEVKRLTSVIAKAKNDGDDDTVNANQGALYAAQQKAKVLQGQVIMATRQLHTGTALAAPSAPSVGGDAGDTAPAKPSSPAGLNLSTDDQPEQKQPTPEMLQDVAKYGDGYRKYLTQLGYVVPDVAPVAQPASPSPIAAPAPTPAPAPQPQAPAATPASPLAGIETKLQHASTALEAEHTAQALLESGKPLAEILPLIPQHLRSVLAERLKSYTPMSAGGTLPTQSIGASTNVDSALSPTAPAFTPPKKGKK